MMDKIWDRKFFRSRKHYKLLEISPMYLLPCSVQKQ